MDDESGESMESMEEVPLKAQRNWIQVTFHAHSMPTNITGM